MQIEVGRSFTAHDVMGVLQYSFAVRGAPEHLRSDNGSEFVSEVICCWLKHADVKTMFTGKGSAWDNGYVESFNGKLRDKLLNREILSSFLKA